ncbi:MAG: methylamine utilization protein [Gammaproteobacteria bacterium]|nr:methylamine utilization protein [Gammaproteobacteria bacterium]
MLHAGSGLPCHAATVELVVHDQLGAALENAVVFVVPKSGASPASPTPAVIDQVAKAFLPKVSIVEAGAEVTFPNKDNIKHHVYSFSPAKVFELKLYSGIPAKPVRFERPGIVTLGCNIHDGMIAYVYVVDSPYHALTDATGKATLGGVPPADYTLHVWHFRMPSTAAVSQPIAVRAQGASAAVTLKVEPDAPVPPPLE